MLLTCRTPLRVSFFGGGTDYPEYIAQNRGAVLGMAIDKYVYISALKIGPFLDYKYRLSYSKHERVNQISEIEHPVVRAILSNYEYDQPLDISVLSDLPARSGLGSSSSFTVGFLNLISKILEIRQTKHDLAKKAISVERDMLLENVGLQDQHHAAFGGINRFDFYPKRTQISPVQISGNVLEELSESLFIVFTGIARYASETLDKQIENTKQKLITSELSHLLKLTDQAVDVLESDNSSGILREFGELLHESWETKRKLSKKVSTPAIDDLYTTARRNGALGGKLCGAGGGGFFLLLVPPEARTKVINALLPLRVVPIRVDCSGSTIIYS